MSTKQIFRISLLAAAGATTMAMAAQAQSSRYGGGVYQYESAPNCGQACVPAQQGRYAEPVAAPAPAPMGAPVYVDCTQIGTCAPAQPTTVYTQPAPVYTQPAPTYSTQSYSTQSYTQAAPVNCPAGTTAQPDGTCMQTGSSYSSSTSYDTTSSYSGSSYSGATSTYSGTMADCPAGTTAQPDGTCMQTGSSSYSTGSSYSSGSSSYSSGSSYSSTPSYSASTMVDCPAGTTAQADGTCMQGGANAYAGSSVEIYQGDASTSTGYGYQSDGAYGATDYLPVRK